MNKKVLTLCAGLLLAGGTFGTINAAISATAQAAAAELTISEKYVVDYGKYFVLERANLYTGSWTSTGSDKFYLTEDAQGNLVYSIDPDLKDKSAYWTIEDVTSNNDPRECRKAYFGFRQRKCRCKWKLESCNFGYYCS